MRRASASARSWPQEAPVAADMVIPVPDSGVPAALGFAAASGLPFELGIIRNHYVGRTFIEPTERIRHLGVRRKHNPNRAELNGKRVILIDDSIVRGTTSKKIVQMVRDAGAAEVHFRVASPPTTPFLLLWRRYAQRPRAARPRNGDRGDAPLHRRRQPGVRLHGRALPRDGRGGARSGEHPRFCDACFSGDYPIALTDAAGGAKTGQLSFLAEVA